MNEPVKPTDTQDHLALGIDIGGTGMKAALVDVTTGELASKRKRVDTPGAADPKAMTAVVEQLVGAFDHEGPVGATFPGVVLGGRRIETAANLDPTWVGADGADRFEQAVGRPIMLVNDADAAGVAEMEFGAGRGVDGTVVMITIGTGLGSSVFVDGTLVPNTEFGHLELDGVDAESRAAGRVVKREGLTIDEWSARFARYLAHLESLLWPELFVLGGGLSKRFDQWSPALASLRTPCMAASFRNHAGIVGAAMVAHTRTRSEHQSG